jgi:hypothetical protein
MAGISCTTGSIGYGTVSQSGHTQIITLNGNFYGVGDGFTNYAYWTFGVTHTDTAPYNFITGLTGWPFSDEESGAYSYTINGALQGNYTQLPALQALSCDTTYVRRAKITDDGGGSAQGYSIAFKTYAVTAVAGTPASSSVLATTATINCNYYPNTVESTATIWLEYKKSTDSAWTTAGATTDQTGYTILNLSRNLTGLTGSTQYQFRLQMTRTTANETTLTSATSTFTTAAAAPTVTTVAAGNVANTSATLNATVDPNGISTVVGFQYSTDSGLAGATYIEYGTISADGDTSTPVNISSLTVSTTYYYRARGVYAGGTVFGSILSFSTSADPDVVAAKEARMQVYEYKRKYGVILTAQPLFFTLQTKSGTNSDTFLTGYATFDVTGTGDCRISIDNGATWANCANVPVAKENGYALVLTAAEMAANEIDVIIKDESGGATPDFRDCHLRIITNLQLGSVDIDAATGTKANTTAFKVTGYGSGNGFQAIAGATGKDISGILGSHSLRSGLTQAGSAGGTIVLDASASASDDFYNGNIVVVTAGTAIGQARVITDYVQSTKTCSVHKTWVATPGTGDSFLIIPGDDLWEVSPLVELAALPTAASSFGKLVQFLFQRFAYKRTQTATTHTMMKADSTTPLVTAGVADSGGTQSFNKLA